MEEENLKTEFMLKYRKLFANMDEKTDDEIIGRTIIQLKKEAKKELLKYKKFHDHIKAHFEKEHPEWVVKCKICDKTFDEIVEEKSIDL